MSELFVGYTPFYSSAGLRFHFCPPVVERAGEWRRRVMWENEDRPHERVFIDINEVLTETDAVSALETYLREAAFQFEEGPSDWGISSFVYPEREPMSVCFSRANLMIRVVLSGRDRVPLEPWVQRITRDLDLKGIPDGQPGLEMSPTVDQRRPDAIELSYDLQWTRGRWAWNKFETAQGALERVEHPKRVLFIPDSHGSVVTGRAVEPGRETYHGSFEFAD